MKLSCRGLIFPIVALLMVAVQVPVISDGLTISDAKKLANGTPVSLTNKIAVTGKSDFSPTLRQFLSGTSVGTMQSASINEASGLAASRKNSGVLWVHNDPGDTARVFAVNANGTLLGTYNLSGVSAADWEDIAIGPGPVAGKRYLYCGDIGDNNSARTSVQVYRVEEPTVSATQQPVTVTLTGVQRFNCQYSDGPRDAETLMVDPRTGDLYIVSKRTAQSRVYRGAVASLVTTGTVTLNYIAQFAWNYATAGDISPQGDEIAIRGYGNASVWVRPPSGNLWDAFSGTEFPISVASEPQGEALAYDASGIGYYTTSEFVNQPIYYFARNPGAGSSFLYVEELNRASGIRVAASPGSVSGLIRGKTVNVSGVMGTTASGERQVSDATITLAPDAPASKGAHGMNGRAVGGSNLGTPPLGQAGISGGHGLNYVGKLVTIWGG